MAVALVKLLWALTLLLTGLTNARQIDTKAEHENEMPDDGRFALQYHIILITAQNMLHNQPVSLKISFPT